MTSYPGALAAAFVYPLRAWSGILFVAILSVSGVLLHTIGEGVRRDPRLYVGLAVALLACSYFYRIVEATVTGQDRPPGLLDDPEEVWEELSHFLGGLLVAFFPVGFLLLFAAIQRQGHLRRESFLWVLGGCAFLGTVYLPMALLLNGFTRSWGTAFNLGVGLRGIARTGTDYFLCAALFVGAAAVGLLLEFHWVGATERGLNGPRALAGAGTAAALAYLGMVLMRALGALYARHVDRLGWTLGEGEPDL